MAIIGPNTKFTAFFVLRLHANKAKSESAYDSMSLEKKIGHRGLTTMTTESLCPSDSIASCQPNISYSLGTFKYPQNRCNISKNLIAAFFYLSAPLYICLFIFETRILNYLAPRG
ncbi:hypothetical protein BDV30DRAFT_62902 [Aspergillus minisclerotigenes]|uniref:Uncharacterized protein n=1 Tax=Aspergillus minisclerotigenes TaxID=656917 RepID=A0A5N6IJ24_9EURO|nr:hypothetical protein BDV30DRAFT_62902 [Aspergillus minisclerotigenes]